MAEKKLTAEEAAIEKLRPKKEVKGNPTDYFPKESIFTKTKKYIVKGKKSTEGTFTADWLNIALSGKSVVLIKGQALTESELKLFDEEAKAYYLVKVSKTKAAKAETAKATESLD